MPAPSLRRAAVIGNPIGHSKSPVLHAAAYAALGVDIAYDALVADPQDAPDLAARLRDDDSWAGLSCTMPMKSALVPEMDEVSDRVARLGVLNTVIVRHTARGVRLIGENTDVDGIVMSLELEPGSARNRLAILGAGGTAAAAVAAAAQLGFAAVDFIVRDAGRAASAVDLAVGFGLETRTLDVAAAGGQLSRYDAAVSTLPPRAADALVPALLVSAPRAGTPLLDVAYDPWPSALALAWDAAGGRVVDGLSMLVHQAVEQALLFSGRAEDDRELVTNVMCDAVGLPRPLG
ncbi:shikimate dehydrogenase family protein [Zhihengliuella halotolerans]|uniref:Shikimate dehydrogenase n=1 Tax=Zhihengliuella halotolerans TaxID=370736 RepID=A0A4Q8ABQ9_9MICC|nr:shikimate dehydrogenase [Zhihengliuella halotolerans]RZU61474.1 shikimate dehydrogenase [Zhihengliuella halotolerans]